MVKCNYSPLPNSRLVPAHYLRPDYVGNRYDLKHYFSIIVLQTVVWDLKEDKNIETWSTPISQSRFTEFGPGIGLSPPYFDINMTNFGENFAESKQ